jgi:hypothetical protein
LLLAALAVLGLAESSGRAAPQRPISLVAASWPTDLPAPPCEGEVICDVMVSRAYLLNVTTLAGPRVPREVTARAGWHGMPPPGSRLLAALWKKNGQWHASWISEIRPGSDECVPDDLLREYAVPVPSRAYRKGEEICLPSRTLSGRD